MRLRQQLEGDVRMELYVGGYAQGKTDYVKRKYKGEPLVVIDGETTGLGFEDADLTAQPECVLFLHFHLWIRRLLSEGKDAETVAAAWLHSHPDCVIVADEIGNGIVPMERAEREYRDRLGRILISIAAESERVERVICGIGQRLK